MSLPAPVCDYLCRVAIEKSPAYLLVSPTGQLLDWGGSWATYGVDNLRLGEAVCQQIFFLEGLLPLNGLELSLPQLRTDSGWCANVYFFPDKAGDWVLLLDASQDERQATLLQQHRHNLHLLQSQAQLHFPFRPAPHLDANLLAIDERRNLTIVSVNLREFAADSQQHSAAAVFKVFNFYFRAFVEAIVTEAGLVDRLSGETITAYFGILPAVTSAASRAIQAAQKIQAAVQEINQFRCTQAQTTFEVAIGIASGSIALGWVGNPSTQSLGAIGKAVNLAATLQQQARSGEILIDATTWMQAADAQSHFTPRVPPGSIAIVHRNSDCPSHE